MLARDWMEEVVTCRLFWDLESGGCDLSQLW